MPKEVEQQPNQELEKITASQSKETAIFPWLALCAAIFFDIIGMVPILNFFSEPIAKLSLGMWQKLYAPKTDPLITAIVSLILNVIFLGFLPSNVAVVVYAYLKKRAAALKAKMSPERLKKLAQQTA